MRIAQVAPLYESVPPKHYGGTERVVSYLTEELVREGHEVTLFASGDSVTTARLVAACRRALRLDKDCVDPLAHHILLLENVFRHADDYDVIHFHVDYLHFPFSRRRPIVDVTTMTAAWTSLISFHFTKNFGTCRSCRSRTRSASRCRG